MVKKVRAMKEEELRRMEKAIENAKHKEGKKSEYIAVSSHGSKDLLQLCMFSDQDELTSYVEISPLALIAMLNSMSCQVSEELLVRQFSKDKLMDKFIAEVENEIRDGEMDA